MPVICAHHAGGKVYKRISILYPTGNPERPFEFVHLRGVTRDGLVSALRPGVLGLVEEGQLKRRLEGADSTDADTGAWELQLLEQVSLQEVGRYILVFLKQPLNFQVGVTRLTRFAGHTRPNGSGLAVGDGCLTSPGGQDCTQSMTCSAARMPAPRTRSQLVTRAPRVLPNRMLPNRMLPKVFARLLV